MAYKVRMVEMAGKLYLEIPSEVQEDLEINPDGLASVKVYNRRSFLVEINVSADAKRSQCESCLQRDGKFMCKLCKHWICSSCFWEMGGICRKCMGK